MMSDHPIRDAASVTAPAGSGQWQMFLPVDWGKFKVLTFIR